jgi:hypothetical protein
MKEGSFSRATEKPASYVIPASRMRKAPAFDIWPKPQNCQNKAIFMEYDLPYHNILIKYEVK